MKDYERYTKTFWDPENFNYLAFGDTGDECKYVITLNCIFKIYVIHYMLIIPQHNC